MNIDLAIQQITKGNLADARYVLDSIEIDSNKIRIYSFLVQLFQMDFDNLVSNVKEVQNLALLNGNIEEDFQCSIILQLAYTRLDDLNRSRSAIVKLNFFSETNITLNLNYDAFWRGLFYLAQCNHEQLVRNYQKGLDYLEKGLNLARNNSIILLIQEMIIKAGEIYKSLGYYNKSLSYFLEYRNIFSNHENYSRVRVLEGLSSLYFAKGELDLAFRCLNELVTYCRVHQDASKLAWGLQQIASIHMSKGEYNEASDVFTESQELHDVLGDISGKTASNLQIGIANFRQGHWNLALGIFEECLEKFSSLNNIQMVGLTTKFIGEIYRLRGDFDIATGHLKKMIDLFLLEGDKWNLADGYNKLGLAQLQQGHYEDSIQQFQKSISIFSKIGDRSLSAAPLFNMIRVELELNNESHAKGFFDMLEKIEKRTGNELVNIQFRMAQALILKRKTRLKDKVEAQTIFQSIIDGPVFDYELTILASINMVELLLEELRSYGNILVLKQLQEISSYLQQISQKQQSMYFLVESLILKANIELLDGNGENATKLLNQAENTCSDYKLSKLSDKVAGEKLKVKDTLTKWDEYSKRNISFKVKLDILDIGSYIDNMFGSSSREESD